MDQTMGVRAGPARSAACRAERRRRFETLAATHEGVLSRCQLYDFGMSRAEVRHNLRVRRWLSLGRHCVCVHTGPITDRSLLWAAVLEGGPRAFLDGETALLVAGLEHYESDTIRVSVPRGGRIRHRGTRVDIRQTRRWAADDLAGGIRALGELDVLHGCRRRGIPEPDSQVLRRSSRGTYFLDFRWSRWRVVVEVDGIQHTWVDNVVADALRHNTIALEGDTVLRLPVLGLRVNPDPFFDQIAEALRRAGWPG